jgi:tetratricopeptide (TPR) repeat protein
MTMIKMCGPPLLLFLVLFSAIAPAAISQVADRPSFQRADSLFFALDYKNAKPLYEKLISDTSHDALHLNRLGFSLYSIGNYTAAENYYKRALASGATAGLKASILSRLARTAAAGGQDRTAMDEIDSAISLGYINYHELDSVIDFNRLRSNARFKQLRDKIFNSLYPCANDPHSREFDFWIGEWQVYATGTNNYVGHSLIQKISVGCALLENWQSPLSEGKSLNFVDDSTNKWRQVWVGSYANGKQDFVNGEYRDSAMRFTFETKDAGGRRQIGRFIFYNQGPDQVRQFNEISSDEGKTWVTSYDFTYKRVKQKE